MTEIGYLQLYLDTDYILPVIVGAEGYLVKYQNQQGDRRLWLYFSKVTGRDVYESGPAQKASYEAQLNGFYGHFWKNLEMGEIVGPERFPYVELLELSGLLENLRTWCKAMLSSSTPDVVLNFSTTIGMKARKVFADYMTKKGFAIRSYSVEMNELVAEKIVSDNPSSIQPAFGDQLLIIQSAGSQLLLSTLVWCGDSFMQGEKSMELEKQGEDFRRKELATMVVDKMEQSNGGRLTTQEEREAEIAFQMQYADDWYKNRSGSIIRVYGFSYSHYPDDPQASVTVDANQLDLRVEANSRVTTEKVQKYFEANITNRHLHTVFYGDVFCDDPNGENLFRHGCVEVTESQGKFTYFNDNALQETMGCYYYSHRNLVEPIEELQSRFLKIGQGRELTRMFVKNAESLGSLRTAIIEVEEKVKSAICNLKFNRRTIESSWNTYMEKSQFDQAEYVLKDMASDDALAFAMKNLSETFKKIEKSNRLLTDLKQSDNVHVKEVVKEIAEGYERLRKLQKEAKDLEKRPNELRKRTQHYRDVYHTYKELVKDFDSKTRAAKKKILAEIEEKDLTMEPQQPIDIEKIEVELSYTIKQENSGFLGLNRKKSVIIQLQVKDGKELPCPCVLQISDNEISVCRDGWYRDLKKGLKNYEETIPFEEIKSSGKIAKLLPNEQYSNLSPFIRCESITIKK